MKSTGLLQLDDNLQQAGKFHNLQQVCGVSGCVVSGEGLLHACISSLVVIPVPFDFVSPLRLLAKTPIFPIDSAIYIITIATLSTWSGLFYTGSGTC